MSLSSATAETSGISNGIIAVELYDNSSFKFPLTSITTPKQLLISVAKKAGITQTEYFGLSCPRVAFQPGAPADPSQSLGRKSESQTGNSTQTAQEEERIFLLDDVPILDQVQKIPKNKFNLGVKYPVGNAVKDLEDSKCILLMYRELADRFQSSSIDILPRESIVSMISLQCHIKKESSPAVAISHIQDVREHCPKTLLSTLNDEFYTETLTATKALAGISAKDAMKKFIQTSKYCFPVWFEQRFDALHIEFAIPLALWISGDGITISVCEKNVVSQNIMMLPFKQITGWSMTAVDEEEPRDSHRISQLYGGVSLPGMTVGKSRARTLKESMLKGILSGSSGSLNNESYTAVVDSPRSRSKMSKKLMSRIDTENLPFANDRKYKCSLSLSISEPHVQSIELLLVSNFPFDYRFAEQVAFHCQKLKQQDDFSNNPKDVINDDPERLDSPLLCIAKRDCTAKGDDDLMFLAGEEILVKKKLGSNLYLGECQGVEGKFTGEYVAFQRLDQEDIKRSSQDVSSLSTLSGDVLNIHMLDDTRKSIIVQPETTVKQVVKIICEKLEISDDTFFTIFECIDSKERELFLDCPILQQGIRPGSKLFFKLRLLYHDPAELTEPSFIYLYYLQVKQYVLSGSVLLSEAEVFEFGSLQLQATHGDYDAEKYKSGLIGSILTYLPPTFHKMSMTKNESWWQKRLSAAHQQHKGISRTEAEKAYLSMSQRFQLYGYQIFVPIAPENLVIGISRDYLITLDKSLSSIVEKYPLEFDTVKFRNQSLVLEINISSESGEKNLRFLTTKTIQFLGLITLLQDIDNRSKARKKCKTLREELSYIGVFFDPNVPKEYENIRDPDLILESLKNGVVFQWMASSMSSSASVDKSLSEAESAKLNIVSCFENRSYDAVNEDLDLFIEVCHEEMEPKLTQIKLQDIKDALKNKDYMALISIIEIFLTHPQTAAKVLSAKEQNRINKTKPKQSLAATSNNASGQPIGMTQEDFVRKVIDELLQTELNYTKDLENIVVKFVTPLQDRITNAGLSDTSVECDVLAMFGNVEEMSKFNREISNELENASKSQNCIELIGKCFSNQAEKFTKLYQVYCANHSEPAERLPDLKNSPETMAILGMNGDTNNDQMSRHNISSQLIKPVQRIMRYHLLLKELVRYTPENHTGFQYLEDGLQKMKDVAADINEVKRKRDNERILETLQSKLEGFEQALSNFGGLLLSGNMQILDKSFFLSKSKFGSTTKDISFNCFLFEDIMLLCKETKKSRSGQPGSYKFKGYVYTRDLTIKDKVSADLGGGDEFKQSWEYMKNDNQKSYIVTNGTLEEKERWISTLNECCAKSSAKSPSERVDLELLKKRQSDTSIISTDSKKIMKKLSAWKRDFSTETPQADSMDSLAGLPNATINTPSPSVSQQPLVSADSQADQLESKPASSNNDSNFPLLLKQVEDLQITVRQLMEESGKLTQELISERDRDKRLEIELAEERARMKLIQQQQNKQDFIHRSNTSLDMLPSENTRPRAEITSQLESEIQIRDELLESVKGLLRILESNASSPAPTS